jgi:2-C-methyl-D-erythritol 4-phosphate cytidylyltransferase
MARQEYALIVAGGKGTRMQQALPKQFLTLHGLPVLMHTLYAFYRYSPTLPIILVLPEDDFATWQSLCRVHGFTLPVTLQAGGASRYESVKKGLSRIAGDGLVAIHDGVRPLVSEAIIAASFRLAAEKQSAVAAVPLKDSIRELDGVYTRALDRSLFRLIQTPQTFDVSVIRAAYDQPEDATLTDDASLAERAGLAITLFEGSYENIKITTPEDLIVAEALLKVRDRKG